MIGSAHSLRSGLPDHLIIYASIFVIDVHMFKCPRSGMCIYF